MAALQGLVVRQGRVLTGLPGGDLTTGTMAGGFTTPAGAGAAGAGLTWVAYLVILALFLGLGQTTI